MNGTTSSLFEHILNRLPTGYGLGDDEKEIVDGISNHATFQQSLREDHEGDVGIFDTNMTDNPMLMGNAGYTSNVQIAVVTKNGDIDSATKYLLKAFENIKSDICSTGIKVKNIKMTHLCALGKNSNGFQMVELSFSIKYFFIV